MVTGRLETIGILLGIALAVTSVAQASDDAVHRRPMMRPTIAATPVLPVPAQNIPVTPLTLQQEPALPPQVTYRGGQLSIAAQNSTLGDILRAIRTQTGAVMDVPGNPNDRVVGNFGPGPARDVLAALLNGSRYNYVLLGSATNPDSLEHVILTPSSGGASAISAPPPQNPEQAQQAPTPGTPGGDVEQPEDAFGTLDAGNTDEQQPPDVDAQGDNQAAQSDDNNNGFQPGAPNPGGVRSPQQLFQELQQRQQQGQNGQLFQGGPAPTLPNQPLQQQ